MKRKAWAAMLLGVLVAVMPLQASTQEAAGEVPTATQTPEPTAEPTIEPTPVPETPQPTQAPTPEPTPEPTAEPTIEPTTVPETPQPTQVPTAEPTLESTNQPNQPTPAPTTEPIVYPAPAFGGISKDEKQDDPDAVRVHIALRQAEGDPRVPEVIVIPVTDAQVENLRDYLNQYPVTDSTFAQHGSLKIDPNDAQQRYEARIPYGVRFVLAWRVDGVIACEGIFSAYEKPAQPEATPDPTIAPTDEPTAAPQPTPTPVPEKTTEPTVQPTIKPTIKPTIEPTIEPTAEPIVPPKPFYANVYYGYPKDDDADGLYTRSEYRVDLDPALADSDDDGIFDFMDFYLAGRLSQTPCEPTAFAAQACMDAGLLSEGREEEHAWEAARDMAKRWHNGGATLGWADLRNARVLALSNSGVFLADYTESETPTIVRALSMAKIGYPAANRYERVRVFDVTADSTLALLYDRKIEKDVPKDQGMITQDAVLIDTQKMCAYTIQGTQNARALALSLDGSLLAVWKDDELTLWHLQTGEAVRITDKKQLARIEMLAFAADNRLVVSLTQMGYNAFLPDGKPTIGGADALGVFVRSRDSHGMSVYDNEHQLLRIDAQVSLTQAGIYIKGEDGESVRNFAPRQIRIAAGLE